MQYVTRYLTSSRTFWGFRNRFLESFTRRLVTRVIGINFINWTKREITVGPCTQAIRARAAYDRRQVRTRAVRVCPLSLVSTDLPHHSVFLAYILRWIHVVARFIDTWRKIRISLVVPDNYAHVVPKKRGKKEKKKERKEIRCCRQTVTLVFLLFSLSLSLSLSPVLSWKFRPRAKEAKMDVLITYRVQDAI